MENTGTDDPKIYSFTASLQHQFMFDSYPRVRVMENLKSLEM